MQINKFFSPDESLQGDNSEGTSVNPDRKNVGTGASGAENSSGMTGDTETGSGNRGAGIPDNAGGSRREDEGGMGTIADDSIEAGDLDGGGGIGHGAAGGDTDKDKGPSKP
jgi:hypothetical protein